MRRIFAAPVLTATVVISLAACGSSADRSAASSSSAPATMSAATSSSTMPAGHTSAAPTSPATNGGTSTSSHSTPASTALITIHDFAYQVSGPVSPGEKVAAKNTDGVNHTITSNTPGLFNVTVQSNGGRASFTAPSKPGTYPFHCNFHANMHGKLMVK